jgi:hypothetical protein
MEFKRRKGKVYCGNTILVERQIREFPIEQMIPYCKCGIPFVLALIIN